MQWKSSNFLLFLWLQLSFISYRRTIFLLNSLYFSFPFYLLFHRKYLIYLKNISFFLDLSYSKKCQRFSWEAITLLDDFFSVEQNHLVSLATWSKSVLLRRDRSLKKFLLSPITMSTPFACTLQSESVGNLFVRTIQGFPSACGVQALRYWFIARGESAT